MADNMGSTVVGVLGDGALISALVPKATGQKGPQGLVNHRSGGGGRALLLLRPTLLLLLGLPILDRRLHQGARTGTGVVGMLGSRVAAALLRAEVLQGAQQQPEDKQTAPAPARRSPQ